MAKTFTAPFAQTVNNSNVLIPTTAVALTGANSLLTDTPTNTVLLYTAGAEGSLVTSITTMPRVTITATVIYLFIASDASTIRLIDSILMPAQTLSTTSAVLLSSFTNYTEDYPLRLKANEKLYVGTSVAPAAGQIVVAARGMDY